MDKVLGNAAVNDKLIVRYNRGEKKRACLITKVCKNYVETDSKERFNVETGRKCGENSAWTWTTARLACK